jgi:hypothetical protein
MMLYIDLASIVLCNPGQRNQENHREWKWFSDILRGDANKRAIILMRILASILVLINPFVCSDGREGVITFFDERKRISHPSRFVILSSGLSRSEL